MKHVLWLHPHEFARTKHEISVDNLTKINIVNSNIYVPDICIFILYSILIIYIFESIIYLFLNN